MCGILAAGCCRDHRRCCYRADSEPPCRLSGHPGLAHPLAWCSPSQLYAVAYRPTQAAGAQRLEAWPEALAVGATLPTMPLWLSEALCLPLALEESYQATCAALRIRV